MILLGLTAVASAVDTGICRKVFSLETIVLLISDEEMKKFITTIKSPE